MDRRTNPGLDQPQSPLGARFRAIRPHRRRLRQAGHDPHHAPTPDPGNSLNLNRNFPDRLLLTMLSSSCEVSDIVVVAHSMGAMLTVDALRQLRIEGKDRVIARLGRVVLAAPDINAKMFRAQVQAIGPLKPPLLVLVSKDDGALG